MQINIFFANVIEISLFTDIALVNMEKISLSQQHNFDRLNFSTYGLPYDWKSITHYRNKAFRKLDSIGYTLESKVC